MEDRRKGEKRSEGASLARRGGRRTACVLESEGWESWGRQGRRGRERLAHLRHLEAEGAELANFTQKLDESIRIVHLRGRVVGEEGRGRREDERVPVWVAPAERGQSCALPSAGLSAASPARSSHPKGVRGQKGEVERGHTRGGGQSGEERGVRSEKQEQCERDASVGSVVVCARGGGAWECW